MLAIKQIQRFTQERAKDLEAFLAQHQEAEVIPAEHYSIERDATHILSVGNKKIQAVLRPREKPYHVPVIYCIYDREGGVRKPENASVKIKTFTFHSKIDEINAFLSSNYTVRILILPSTGLTPPLDNYYPGEYGPVPDRQPMHVKTHQILVVYKE
ncbi:MAG: hypothetical protein HYW27_03235 [Candidatus Aenigmarchaeota archaeon]|nr:hypothetical protein [Candidatus Aenigmarchaeota archaeon]